MSTFLVPLDGSEATRESLALGYQMASTLGARLGLIYAETTCASTGNLARHDHHDVPVESYVLRDAPDPGFHLWIRQLEQPVVLLQAYHTVPGTLTDLAGRIVDNAGSPVTMLVGRGPSRDGMIQRLLVPLDGSPAAEEILPVATLFALRTGATLGMVRVVSSAGATTPDGVERERDEARAYLNRVASRLRKRGVRTTWEVRIGEAGDEIARAATTTAADLILMASSNYAGLLAESGGSVTETAIHNVHVPVVVARVNSSQLG